MAFGLYRDILADCGVTLTPDNRIMDWGCGKGTLVSEGRAAGYDVIGCDLDTEVGKDPHLSPIDPTTYRLPYPDHSIDVIVSNQVLEHVMDYDGSLAELRRVLKPGGAFLHMFPSRWIPIEPHVYVPGATIVRNRPWLLLWALLGVRNEFQREMSAWERARVNHAYLRAHTNYLTRGRILSHFRRHFREVRFVEDAFLRRSARGRKFASVPLLPRLYSALRGRVVFGRGYA